VRQGSGAHFCRYHLNHQQRVIHAFQRRADPRRLQEMSPDIQSAALDRIDQQRFAGQIFRRDLCFSGQRVVGRQHQTHLKIKHRRIVQAAAWQYVGGQHQIQLVLLQRRLRIKSHAGFEIHLHLRPFDAEVFQRRGQPLNAAMALNGDAQTRLLRFIAGL